MKTQQITLSLSIQPPFLTQASGTINFGLDTAMQRHKDQPIINGSQIKGNIRHTLQLFADLLGGKKHLSEKQINAWFGQETNHSGLAQRGNADFDLFWKLEKVANNTAATRTRISIDSDTGTVKKGHIQVIEDCFPSGGTAIEFRGNILFHYQDEAEVKNFIHWLKKALDYLPAIGSLKGVGYGKVLSASVNKTGKKSPRPQTNKTTVYSPQFSIKINIDRPFCINSSHNDNLLVSDEIIPGNVLKGLFVRHFESADSAKEQLQLDDLIVSHAIPSTTQQRKTAIPLSFAVVNKELFDVVNIETADQIPADADITFSADWKTDAYKRIDDTPYYTETDQPETALIVRTRIKQGTNIAEDSQLFSMECIEIDKHSWYANINLSKIDKNKQQAVSEQLQKLFEQKLNSLGKTKASLTISLLETSLAPPMLSKNDQSLYRVTLNTACRMFSDNIKLKATGNKTKLRQLYQHYWAKYVHPELQLKTFFARQSLSNNQFHQSRQGKRLSYQPEWKTEKGSTFLLYAKTDAAFAALQEIQPTGLPAHPHDENQPARWQTTPSVAPNGFGEISINDTYAMLHTYTPMESEHE